MSRNELPFLALRMSRLAPGLRWWVFIRQRAPTFLCSCMDHAYLRWHSATKCRRESRTKSPVEVSAVPIPIMVRRSARVASNLHVLSLKVHFS
jgi:hypothetical protein